MKPLRSTPATPRARPGIWRLVLASPVLAVIWLWKPTLPMPLPPHTVRPANADALARLPPDTAFLLAGSIYLAVAQSGEPWQGRPIYVQRQRVDRHHAVETVAQRRPALLFRWQDREIAVAADSYSLTHAPRIEPTWSDPWDRSSRGFRDGDPALAQGRTGRDGRYRIESVLESPLEAVEEDLDREHGKRGYLLLVARIAATLFVLSQLLPVRSGGRSAGSRPPAGDAGGAGRK